jgi:hypothetical protein
MIRPILRCFLFPAASAAASAQVELDIYASPSSDGTNAYAAGVLQYNPGSNCTMCNSATHTYQQTVTITSPSGRFDSCGFQQQESAEYSQNLQCEAALPINGEYGDYTTNDSPIVTCSVVGLVLNASIKIPIKLGVSQCSFNSPNYTAPGGGYCLYKVVANCPAKCCPAAAGAPWYPPVPPPPPCAPYAISATPWYSTNGGNTVTCLQPLTVGMVTTDPGACSDSSFP